jgi:hypothetical protein
MLTISAEGMNPEYEKTWVKKVSFKFCERFGNDEITKNSFTGRERNIKEVW